MTESTEQADADTRSDPVGTAGRDAAGRFTSANPGRPRGSVNKATAAARALLEAEVETITRRAIELAIAGDPTALRLCVERIVPALKAEARPVTVEGLAEAGNAAEQGRAILAAVADGRLAPDTAKGLLEAVANLMKIVEAAELEARIQALEAAR